MYPYINLFGRLIPAFGMMAVIGILVASTLAAIRCKKRNLSVDNLILLITITLSASFIGAKFLYIVVTYSFDQVISMIRAGQLNFLMSSGLVFYGGLFTGGIGLYLCYRFFGIQVMDYESAIMPVVPLGHAFGRIGCFLAGCCHGKAYCGIGELHYHEDNVSGLDPLVGYFPSPLVESFFNLCIFVVLVIYLKKERPRYNSILLYTIMYSVLRFFVEFTRGDEIRGSIGTLSTSQWISFLLIIGAVVTWVIKDKIIRKSTRTL